MNLTKSLLPHHEYRDVLMDFREQLFHRFLLVMMLFIGMSINIALLQRPRSFLFLGLMLLFLVVFWEIRALYKKVPNLARYLFVMMLYLLLFSLIAIEREPSLAYLIVPVMLMSSLLMSRITLIATGLFCVYIMIMAQAGYPVSEMGIISLTLISYLVIRIAVSTFNVALSWYSSMHHHADSLLEETRDRRAELLSTLKSLETAYQTQRRLQRQLIYARKQAEDARRMKERFASNISHELRTPLNIILGFSEIMHLTPEIYGNVIFPPKLHRDIYQIHHNSKHLLAMIDDVLDLSHIEMSEFSLNFEKTDLNDFLRDTVEMLSHYFDDSAVEFISDIPENLPEIEIDRTRIRQIFINLITNAGRFTDRGYVRLIVQADDRQIDFIVEDTGRGIEAEKVNLIFEEFYQVDYSLSRQHGGAGLGLTITKQFVEAHNGRLNVESVFGQGSVFTFSLPNPEQSRNNSVFETGTMKQIVSEEKETVLFIDADPHTGSLLTRHLASFELVQVADVVDVPDSILEHNPVAIVHNRLPDTPALDSLSIPIIECSLAGSQWLSSNLQVERSLAKPISPTQVAEILSDYPNVTKLLIVDDDIGFVQLMHRSIEGIKRDFLIRRAYDGVQAYDIIREDRPDLIFLDLAMPEMSGQELIDLLQEDESLREIPIILLTATRYLQSDEEWLSGLEIHKQGGINARQTLGFIKSILTDMTASGR